MQLNGMVPLFQKGCVYGDLVFGQDSLASRSISVGWETDVTEYGAEYLLSEEEGDSFIEGTHTSQNCCNRGDISVGGTLTAGLPNVLSVDDGLCTKFSSPLSEFNCPDSALINMNLRGLENQPCSENFKFQRTFFGYSAESFPPIEPSRSAGLSSQAFFCQVFGCNKDLSSSKDYHKRHRVCDRHSKTAKVIVDGIEKRFCQQCSRFHLLSEFDEGKRSCRRRWVIMNADVNLKQEIIAAKIGGFGPTKLACLTVKHHQFPTKSSTLTRFSLGKLEIIAGTSK